SGRPFLRPDHAGYPQAATAAVRVYPDDAADTGWRCRDPLPRRVHGYRFHRQETAAAPYCHAASQSVAAGWPRALPGPALHKAALSYHFFLDMQGFMRAVEIQRILQFSGRFGMNTKQRLSLFNNITQTYMHLHTGSGCNRSSGQTGQTGDHTIVEHAHNPVAC